MAATTVRVEAKVKKELDAFQGYVQSETGERVSHSELLARLVRFARQNEARFLASGEEGWTPPTKEQLEELLGRVRRVRLPKDLEVDATRIDEVLYGGDAP